MTKKRASPTTDVHGHHADHCHNLTALNRVIGQLEGVRRMVDERRYCADILVQTRAAAAALKKIELTILKTHMNNCVSDAFREKAPAKAKKKIEELVKIMERF
jgi:CsoR family transcriptional regulator, copper-sensing transcriptional repressor